MELIVSAAGPATGNISASVYIIIGIIAAVVIIITAAVGMISKKNKK
ncbi:MAG: LPXTG cell wall anchor domain-containing protein [Oscillospiraceae bacterium]